ncbi:MAG: hypothetical protein K2O32_00410 [Acetatifactor sp.]|nr:hypothetical protein [Acetatifactor sp.]
MKRVLSIEDSALEKRMQAIIKSKYVLYIIIAILSAIAFVWIYGIRVLDPTYTEWLMRGGDLTQHYLGWKAYRMSEWMLPLGLTDALAYPSRTSIIFTDSIPIFAFFAKLFSPILPDSFQYFALWGIICFMLQGVLAARIIENYTKDRLTIIMTSLLFVFTPIMIFRMFAHTSLAGQWILLLALEPIFSYQKYSGNKKIYALICLIGVLVASIHIYFVLMCGIILVGVCLEDVLYFKRVKRSLILLVIYFAAVCVTVGIWGGFSSGASYAREGLGKYSFNLNALFNSQDGWSCIFISLPLYGNGQYEGIAYLGAGCIFILLLAVLAFISSSRIKNIVRAHWREAGVLLLISFLAVMVAVSPRITYGDKVIAELQFPEWMIKIWMMFRSTGRIAWVLVYVVMLCAIILLIKLFHKRMILTVVMFSVVLQVYDLHGVISILQDRFGQTYEYHSALQDTDFWDSVAGNSEIEHIVFTTQMEKGALFAFTDWALSNHKTVSSFHFARVDMIEQDLSVLSPDNLYVFTKENQSECLKYDLNYYLVDGYIIGCLQNFENSGNAIDIVALMRKSWTFGDNQYVRNGEDIQGERWLYEGGYSYGPYWSVTSGDYLVTIEGENIQEKAQIVIYSQGGNLHHDYEVLESTADTFVLSLSLENDVEDIEICVYNTSKSSIKLKSIELQIR